jgi:hypothetical protein
MIWNASDMTESVQLGLVHAHSPKVSWQGSVEVRCRCIAWEPDLPVCSAHSHKPGLQDRKIQVNSLALLQRIQ